jgi:hypothetical protein
MAQFEERLPEENRLAEHLNGIFLERVRALLHASRMP